MRRYVTKKLLFKILEYNGDMLQEERMRLRGVKGKVIVDYIKTSIEILLNMKLEEQLSDLRECGALDSTKVREKAKLFDKLDSV
jgi:hypothetical protein